MEEIDGKQFYLDGILKNNLNRIKENIQDDWDYLFVVDGEVGSGKSVFAQTIAYYCTNGKLTADSVCFTPEGFRDAIMKAPKYGAVVFDEAFRGLSARAAMTQTNRILIAMLNEIRQKNLFVFIVLPSVWDVDGYVAKHRMKGLFHVYVNKERQRGYFRFYSNKKMTYYMADTRNKYRYPKDSNFHGKFRLPKPRYLVGEDEYLTKKNKSLGKYVYEKDQKKKESKKEKAAVNLIRYMKEEGYNWHQITDAGQFAERTGQKWLKEGDGVD